MTLPVRRIYLLILRFMDSIARNLIKLKKEKGEGVRMSVYNLTVERIQINNTNERTKGILNFIKDQIMHTVNLDWLNYAVIADLKLNVDGRDYFVCDLHADSEKDQKIVLPEELMECVKSLPEAKAVSLLWTYETDWYAAGHENEMVKYGIDAMFSILRKEDANIVKYAGINISDDDWNAGLFICDLKDGEIRFGQQDLSGDHVLIDDIETWRTENTAVQIDMDFEEENLDLRLKLETICRELSTKVGGTCDDLSADASGFYFALNEANIKSKGDLTFYIDQIKQLYFLTDGELFSDTYFYHTANEEMAVMRIYFDENGALQIKAARY